MFKLSFDTDSDAFADSPELEIEYILHVVVGQVVRGEATGKFQPIRDSNGNQIGTWKLNPEEAR